MSNEYLYGAYGHIGQSVAQSAIQAGTVPVYLGTAPVNLIRGYAKKDIINYPTKISNYTAAQQAVGYSDAWDSFTLCEVINAHFNNEMGNIGPVYVINVLDPDIHRKAEKTSLQLAFSNGRAAIKSDTIILDTFAIADKSEGADFTIDYNFTKKTVVINSIGTEQLSGTIQVSFWEVDPSEVKKEDIIGEVTAGGVYSGLGALRLLYQEHYAVCNLLAAPGWSSDSEVYHAMISAASQINGHWNAFVMADIPVTNVTSIAAAKTWKTTNGYSSECSKVFWPMAKDSTGKVYHLSTLGVVESMRADYSHDSIPMETCGNKKVPIVAQYFGAESVNRGFDQVDSKELTSNGMSTCVFWGGNWVLWGDHTAEYAYGADVDPRCIFDVSMRMLFHITNGFQREWGTEIDKPFSKQLRDRIINREQEKLDAYVAIGALVGTPEVLFLESNNSETDMMNGDFRWDIPVTPTPPLKSATVYVAYTDSGFAAYFKDEE